MHFHPWFSSWFAFGSFINLSVSSSKTYFPRTKSGGWGLVLSRRLPESAPCGAAAGQTAIWPRRWSRKIGLRAPTNGLKTSGLDARILHFRPPVLIQHQICKHIHFLRSLGLHLRHMFKNLFCFVCQLMRVESDTCLGCQYISYFMSKASGLLQLGLDKWLRGSW